MLDAAEVASVELGFDPPFPPEIARFHLCGWSTHDFFHGMVYISFKNKVYGADQVQKWQLCLWFLFLMTHNTLREAGTKIDISIL